uniref:Transcription and mRNA export factor ENY2 n=2 Tax=Hemiselmis andersenii TaxID=464988 RepID=A0A6U4MNW3_HEMAN|mmetsp:Transcript_3677/g.8791  ORF Transcript_3677/g.8791 Transcript_3677/m.8791 type:complete len:128 (+) Transcript_3677:225-608(+)
MGKKEQEKGMEKEERRDSVAGSKAGGGEKKQGAIEKQIREGAIKKVNDSEERDRLRELLKKRLKDAGWEEEMKEYIREAIRNKCLEDLSVESLVSELEPTSRAAVPDAIRSEIIGRITKYLRGNSDA